MIKRYFVDYALMNADVAVDMQNGSIDIDYNGSEPCAYRHTGFWQPMDTLHDKNGLEQLWASGNAPWKMC